MTILAKNSFDLFSGGTDSGIPSRFLNLFVDSSVSANLFSSTDLSFLGGRTVARCTDTEFFKSMAVEVGPTSEICVATEVVIKDFNNTQAALISFCDLAMLATMGLVNNNRSDFTYGGVQLLVTQDGVLNVTNKVRTTYSYSNNTIASVNAGILPNVLTHFEVKLNWNGANSHIIVYVNGVNLVDADFNAVFTPPHIPMANIEVVAFGPNTASNGLVKAEFLGWMIYEEDADLVFPTGSRHFAIAESDDADLTSTPVVQSTQREIDTDTVSTFTFTDVAGTGSVKFASVEVRLGARNTVTPSRVRIKALNAAAAEVGFVDFTIQPNTADQIARVPLDVTTIAELNAISITVEAIGVPEDE